MRFFPWIPRFRNFRLSLLTISFLLDDTGLDQLIVNFDICAKRAPPKPVHYINVKIADTGGRRPHFPEQAR